MKHSLRTVLVTFVILAGCSTHTALADTTFSGAISGDIAWTKAAGPYIVDSLDIPVGATLSLLPGTIVKMTAGSGITVEGTLNVGDNISSDLSVITSLYDDSVGGDTNGDGTGSYPSSSDGNWEGITIGTSGVINLHATDVRYGGRHFCSIIIFGCQNFPMVTNSGGTLTLDRSALRSLSPYIGNLEQSGGSTIMTTSQISNGGVGILLSGGTLVAHGSDLINNLGQAIRNNTGGVVDVTENWWGDASGPSHDTNPSGVGSRILGNASFSPWLVNDPFAPVISIASSPDFGYASDATSTGVEPNIAASTTPLVFKVVYTNSWNQAPGAVVLKINSDDPSVPCQVSSGPIIVSLIKYFISIAYADAPPCLMSVDSTATTALHDGDFTNGEQYIISEQFSVGFYTFSISVDGLEYLPGFEQSFTVDDSVVTSPPPPICTPDCHSSILFLPGLEASRLYRPTRADESGTEKQLWEPTSDSNVEDLFLDANGKQPNPFLNTSQIYTKDVVDEAYVDNAGPNIYKSFLVQLSTMKNTTHVIADYSAVPYDWRLSLQDVLAGGTKTGDQISYLSPSSDPYIQSELRRLVAGSDNGKVTIIAHSNGGLVAKLLLKQLEGSNDPLLAHIDKLILIASPQLGTPEALGALLFGFEQGIPTNAPVLLSQSTARTFAENSPGAYNLLPSATYFDLVHDSAHPLISFDSSPELSAYRSQYGQVIGNGSELQGLLLGNEGRPKPQSWDLSQPNVLNSALTQNAAATHVSIDDWVPTSTIKVLEIAGWGNDTLAGFKFWMEPNFNSFGTTFRYTPDMVEDGDGTVVVPSALSMASATNVTQYWVNMRKYSRGPTIDRDHKDILEVTNLLGFLQDSIIDNVDSSLFAYSYISTSTPHEDVIEAHRLHYYLHSPLSLDLYDGEGHHTGISTTTGQIESLIPETYYRQIGEVKYISAPASTTLNLVMNGQATGIFTLIIDEVQGDIVTASTTFLSVPSSTSTVVTLDTPIGGGIASSSALHIDENGDGTIDYNLAPKLNGIALFPIVIPDTTSPTTTATTSGTIGNNGWYMSNVLVTLTATDTASGVASTTYSLNGGGSWNIYTSPFVISSEGTTSVSYRSIDKAGNSEAMHILSIKLDKTAPEANILVSTSTQDLLVLGTDTLGTTTIAKDTSGNYTITDKAGHITKLFFTKTFSGKLLTYAKLTGIQYDSATKVTLPTSSFLYVWDTKAPIVPVSQTIVVNDTYIIQTLYSKQTNKTTVIVLKKNVPIQSQVFTGLEIVKLTTSKGVVGYGL